MLVAVTANGTLWPTLANCRSGCEVIWMVAAEAAVAGTHLRIVLLLVSAT